MVHCAVVSFLQANSLARHLTQVAVCSCLPQTAVNLSALNACLGALAIQGMSSPQTLLGNRMFFSAGSNTDKDVYGCDAAGNLMDEVVIAIYLFILQMSSFSESAG